MVDCPVEDVLGAFLSGSLDAAVAAEVERHIADCSRCVAAIGLAIGGDEPPGGGDEAPMERGVRLDRYHVLDLAGTGAVGMVYAAYDPKLDRKVALKVLRRAAPELEERLLREARALARVHSPHVVAVHDAGTSAGRVYIAMEYVEGPTLREWLARPGEARGVAEVLDVFIQAGRGLAAAHAAAVIHRDFKPDNVLVRPGGQVAVTDFGLAWAAADREAEAGEGGGDATTDLHLTSTGALIGTPAYMAPELIDGGRADARSDVFAFCVALYAALYQRHPFPTESLAALRAAMLRGDVAAPRSTVARRVREAVLAGLAPRPEDRPPSMDALLERLRPAPARRVSLVVAGVAVAAAAALALRAPARTEPPCQGAARLLGGVWDEPIRGEVRRALAATGSPLAADATRGVERALDDYAARWSAGRTAACEATRVRGEQSEAALDRRVACLDDLRMRMAALVASLPRVTRPQVEQVVMAVLNLPAIDRCADPRAWADPSPPPSPAFGPLVTLARATAARAKVQAQLGDYPGGQRALAPALAVAETSGDRGLQAEVRLLDGQMKFIGDPKGAEKSLEAAAVAAQASGRADLAGKAWLHLARRLARPERIDDALRWADLAEAAIERSGDPLLRADLLVARGIIYQASSQTERAIPLFREAIATFTAHPGALGVDAAEPMSFLANALLGTGRAPEALPLRQQIVEMHRRALGPDHPNTLASRASLAHLLRVLGHQDEALAMLTEIVAADERVFGPRHLATADALGRLALVETDVGRAREAIENYKRALSIKEEVYGPTASELVGNLVDLAGVLSSREHYDEAESLALRAIRIAEPFTQHGQSLAGALLAHGHILAKRDKCPAALPVLERARAVYEAAGAADKPQICDALDPLARCQALLGRPRDAEATYLRSLAIREKAFGPNHPFDAESLAGLSAVVHQMGDDRRAAALAARALDILTTTKQTGNNIAEARLRLAEALWSSDRAAARAQARLALADLEPFPDHPLRRDVVAWLGRAR